MVPKDVLSSCCTEHREFSEVLESKSFLQPRRSDILVATAANEPKEKEERDWGTEITQAFGLHRRFIVLQHCIGLSKSSITAASEQRLSE